MIRAATTIITVAAVAASQAIIIIRRTDLSLSTAKDRVPAFGSHHLRHRCHTGILITTGVTSTTISSSSTKAEKSYD
uniref:Putative secreted peptide n=1 Tax=Anopheles braziliensis TaxID=58242 RepID=A0A2M3ZRT3_9DIPT